MESGFSQNKTRQKIRPEIQKYLDKLKEETKKDLELADKIDKEIANRRYETWFGI